MEGPYMPLDFTMKLMSAAEFTLWVALGIVFWIKGLHHRFPAMSVYLALRVASMPALLSLLYIQEQPWGHGYFPAYFYAYWSVYIGSAITLFFVCIEIFRAALSSFTGLIRLGTVVFRWAALVSLLVSLASATFSNYTSFPIANLAYALMRSVSILELCLLGFLCLSMNALRLSPRDLSFGLALGFGLMSANDFIVGALLAGNSSLTSPLQFLNESLILVSLIIWVAYVTVPEPARRPVTMPANSTIYRWNEIAAALGHGTQVAVHQPANSFFLTDVEKVVDKVLTRNLQSSESKSEA